MKDNSNRLESMLHAITKIQTLMVNKKDLDQVIKELCEILVETRQYKHCSVSLLNDNKKIGIHAQAGEYKFETKWECDQFGNGNAPSCVEKALKTGKIIINNQGECNCKFSPEPMAYLSTALAIKINNENIGVILISSDKELLIDEYKKQLLKNVVDTLSIYIKNYRNELLLKSEHEKLKESEEKYRSLYANAPMSYQSLNEDGYILDVNQKWLQTMGYDRNEVIGKWFGSFLFPDFVAHFRKNFPNFITAGCITGVQFKMKHKSGKLIYVEFEGCVGYNADGTFKQTYCVFTDITEAKKLAEELKEKTKQFDIAIKGSNDGIWDWNLETNELFLSQKWKHQLGYNDDEITNDYSSFEDNIYCDDKEYVLNQSRLYLNKKIDKYDIEFRMVSKNGSICWIRSRAEALWDKSGKAYRMVGFHTDITDQKKSEILLKASEEKFRLTFETSPDSININRLEDGVYININHGFTQITGYKKDEVIGRSSLELNIWKNPKDREKLVKGLKEKGYVKNLEAEFVSKDGTTKWGLMSANILTIDNEKVILSITRDITDRKLTEEKIAFQSHVLNQINDMVVIADLDGKITYLNKSEKEQFGDLIGKDTAAFGETKNSITQQEILEETLKNGSWRGEIINYTPDGKKLILDSRIQVIKDINSNKPVALVGVSTDITKKKNYQIKLEQTTNEYLKLNHELETILDNLPAYIYYRDAKGVFLRVNEKVAESHNLTKSQIRGKSIFELYPGEIAERAIEYDKDIIKSKIPQYFIEEKMETKDGTKWVSTSKIPFRDINSKVIGVIGISLDITELKLATRKLKESEARFNDMLNCIPDMVSVHDIDFNILYSNWNGFGSVEQEKRKLHTKCYETYRGYGEICPDCWTKDVLKSQKFQKSENQLQDGTWIDSRVFPLFDQDGKMYGIVEWIRDITQRKNSELALQKRLFALTNPMAKNDSIKMDDLFSMDDLQKIQDQFALFNGVASIITDVNGKPITNPSNFTRLCSEIIRNNKQGEQNCFKSDAKIGTGTKNGPTIQPCLSCGLWDAGTPIKVGDKHIANWLIGQVRDESQSDEKIREYAKEIGVDENESVEAFWEVPAMSGDNFQNIVHTLFLFAEQLSIMAFQNLQQARFINEKDMAENQAAKSETKYSNLINNLPVGIFQSTIDGKVLTANPAMAEIYGYESVENLLTRPAENYYSENNSREKMLEILQKQGDLKNYVTREYKSDGTEIWISSHYKGTFDKNGNLSIIDGIIDDITEKVKKDEELKILTTAIEQSPSIIVITDLSGNIVYTNPKFCEITGYNRNEVYNANPRILKSGKLEDQIYQELWQKIENDQIWKGEFQNKKKNGELFWESALISPIFDAQGKKIRYLKVSEDITKYKIMEEEKRIIENQRKNSQKLETVGTLAGGIAHDFNNILTPILGYSGLIKKHVSKDEIIYEEIDEIYNAGLRAKDLIEQILNFSRQTETKKTPLFLHLILKEAVKLLRPTIPAMIEIRQNIDKNCRKVMMDGSKIHQIIINICTNAAFAMKDQTGTLKIEMKEVNAEEEKLLKIKNINNGIYSKLIISDTGVGIPAEIMDRIFDPFFTTKKVGEGTGLGLSVVHGIITEHKGYIFVESEVNQGTTFTIYLPILEIDNDDRTVSKVQKEIIGGTERLLIVDDREDVTKMLKRMLADFGYTIIMFNDVENAYEYYQDNSSDIDLLLTDYAMPKMSGIELSEKIRTINSNIPIIVASGNASKINVEKIELLKDIRVVGKPILIFELAKLIRELLDKNGVNE